MIDSAHTVEDDEIVEMLSGYGSTAQVWYHAWHGDFVQMMDIKGDHD